MDDDKTNEKTPQECVRGESPRKRGRIDRSKEGRRERASEGGERRVNDYPAFAVVVAGVIRSASSLPPRSDGALAEEVTMRQFALLNGKARMALLPQPAPIPPFALAGAPVVPPILVMQISFVRQWIYSG